jgi:hypothetical protein
MLKATEFRRQLRGEGPHSADTDYSPAALAQQMLGDFPDYRRPDINALWAEAMAMPVAETVALCRRHGIDILAENGERVSFWIDIAVVLLARERG